MCTLPGVTYHIPSRSYVVDLVSTFAGVFPCYVSIIAYRYLYASSKVHKDIGIYLLLLHIDI